MNPQCPVCGNRKGAYTVAQDCVRDPTPDYAPKALSCDHCDAAFLWPPMSTDAQRRFYLENAQVERTLGQDFDWNDYVKRTQQDTERRAQFLAPFLRSSDRLLEVGCGYGFLLSLLKKQVKEAIGIEPGSARRVYARNELGLDIRQPPTTAAGIDPSSIDIVCAFQVLEHIGQPHPFLCDLFDLLKPSGRLIIEVPNYADAYVSLLPSYRTHHFQIAHAVYYTPKTVRFVVEKTGFIVEKVIGVQRYAVTNALHWALHGQPQMRSPSREVHCRGITWLDRAYRRFLAGILRSDTLICLARKKTERKELT